MASKTHVDMVNERRLRPIYDSLDNGNNKKALQEADKVLKKDSNNQCARVLKALALLRLGKESECQTIMDKVSAEVPCDDSTLQAMTICYREIHQPGKISEMYEAAAKADPTNEELLTHLFMSYVRLGDFKKQQHSALALYKLVPKNPYYFWAVMSIVMQAIQAEEKLAKQVILPLAERMVLKLVNEGKMEAEQEVQLYLMILELQEKNEAILEVLSGSLAHHLSQVPEMKARLLLKLKRYPEAISSFKNLISKNIDNWEYYLRFIEASLESNNLEDCLQLLNEQAAAAGSKARAPHLAHLELLKCIQNTDQKCEIDPIHSMREYFAKFGSKGCVVGDLRLYLHLLSQEDRCKLIEQLDEDIGVPSDGYPTSKEQMQRHVHLEQLRRICGFHHAPLIDLEKRKLLVERLVNLYENGSSLCPVQERLPTDICVADPYIILAVHVLYQIWYETKDAAYLYRMMRLLEKSLVSSYANFHVKILLVRTYVEAGLIAAAYYALSLLDLKHVQIDSLSYLAAPLFAPLGLLSQAGSTLDSAAKFFVSNYKDSADHLTLAYKYGSFLKIREFVDLQKRLEFSINFTTTTMDKMLLELSLAKNPDILFASIKTMQIQPHEDGVRWDQLRDNRDLDVIVSYEPLSSESSDELRMRSETRDCMVRLLKARHLMLRIIGATNKEDSSDLLSKLASELKTFDQDEVPQVLKKFVAEDGSSRLKNLLIPVDALIRLKEAHDSEQLSIVARLAESLAVAGYPDASCIKALRASACLLPLPIGDYEKPLVYRDVVIRATTCSETIAYLTAMCIAFNLSKTGTSHKKNKKKQNKEILTNESDNDKIVKNWQEVNVLLTERLEGLENHLTDLQKIHVGTGLKEEDDFTDVVFDRAQTSIIQSCKALKSRTLATSKLLSSWHS